ncbi:alkyldihydroxyacetonephosphate synthase [Mumia flava]|uniref:Alkyldihydroxyacetonephosphate synthase n=1 Tax=Mumia flava TaxID=1348852 RepID=A0A0B2BQA1_9ACTN|nr:FAD-binding oxidoreductase [Mumia flava]PJJ53667.1 alkyldihydroxyacetonephosphate synthase [Mumia flava]
MTESDLPPVPMLPGRWGDPARAAELPESLRAALAAFGVSAPGDPVALDDVALPDPLDEALAVRVRAIVGDEGVRLDRDARLAHTRGYSTPDLLRLRAGDATQAPDAVVTPSDHETVVALLELCASARIAVVPFGGGTSVVGGLAPQRGRFAAVIALDLSAIDHAEEVDEVARTVRLGAGLRTVAAEAHLAARGWTLGHFPQSYEGATIGGHAATRSAGQASAGYGRFDEMVVGLRLATPTGTLEVGTAPRSAAGPDLRQLVLGSEGALGVITEVRVVVRPRPEARVYEGWRFASFDAGVEALRSLAQDGPLPTVLRLSDEAETAVNLADPAGAGGPAPTGALAITGLEGAADGVARTREQLERRMRDLGAEPLGTAPGESWRTGRYHAPYLRDALLDAGAMVETLETATFWSDLARLRHAVTDTLVASLTAHDSPPIVLCHVSHVYPSGASLYFTVACRQDDDPVDTWFEAKDAVGQAIRAVGATITHHHGVGTDHTAPYAAEIGPLGTRILAAVKDEVDPEGVLNPGVLIQARGGHSG